jgi:O-antigen/teichoic acid export membrane protein
MNLGQSIRTGAKWLMIGNTGNGILQFAFGVALARILVPADFGMIITIQVFTGFVGMVTSGGMGQALVRAKKADQNDFSAILTLQLAIAILIYLGFYLFAPWFAEYFENPLYKDLMRVSALVFLIRPFVYMRTSWLNREMEFKKRSIIGIITGIVTGVSSVIMALLGMGVWSLTLSGLLAAIFRNTLLARVTPITLGLNFDLAIMRKHSAYGSKIVANDFLGKLRGEARKLILAKLAGPAFLGLFNKAESLHSMPYRMFASPLAQPLFRAMSTVQDDLDKTKYMLYRAITLLGVYILPFYVLVWWVAEPFIGFVYGEKWLPSAIALKILAMSGIGYIISRPCGAVLMAQNRLTQEMIAQAVITVFAVIACLVGLNWGLEGVSYAFLATTALATIYYYALVYRTIHTRFSDLVSALSPGLMLNTLLFLVLAVIDATTGELGKTTPWLYLLIMVIPGVLVYMAAFLFLPILSLRTESSRWRNKINGSLSFISKRLI